jgi:serine/threonine protein kinase
VDHAHGQAGIDAFVLEHGGEFGVLANHFQARGYALHYEAGRGQMGVVYRATQLRTCRTVALKLLLTASATFDWAVARFRAEARAMARLNHPGIVTLYDFCEEDAVPHLVMEFVDGVRLSRLLDGTPRNPLKGARLVFRVALALQHAHALGLVHRDLKPAHVLLGYGWERMRGRPKVCDWGLVKMSDSLADLTQPGQCLGTPGYMAPEQSLGRASEAVPATDVYALGTIFYQILTGRRPFLAAPSPWATEAVTEVPQPPSSLVSSVPVALEAICMKCLEKRPEDRYATAGALAEALRVWLTTRRRWAS